MVETRRKNAVSNLRSKTKSQTASRTKASDTKYLALLRGINVGGKNVIAKEDLKQCFEELGATSVRTYIQSGNILFRFPTSSISLVTERIETALCNRFSYKARAVVLTHRQYKKAVASAPDPWAKQVDEWKHNAIFTLRDTKSQTLLSQLPPPKPEIEVVKAVPGVLFWSVLKQAQTRSTMMKLAAHPLYSTVTVRNHNTVFKLLELFEEC